MKKKETLQPSEPNRVSVDVILDKEVVEYFENREDREELINWMLRQDMDAHKAAK